MSYLKLHLSKFPNECLNFVASWLKNIVLISRLTISLCTFFSYYCNKVMTNIMTDILKITAVSKVQFKIM